MRKLVLRVILSTWQMFVVCLGLAAFTGWACFMSFLSAAGVSFYNGAPEMMSPAFLASPWPNIHAGMAVLLAMGLVYSTYAYVHAVVEEVTLFLQNLRWEKERQEEIKLRRFLGNPYSGAVGYEGT